MNIKGIVLKVVAAQSRFRIGMPAGLTQDFAEALIESYKAELLKEVQGGQPDLREPVYQICKSDSVSLSSAWIDVTEQTYNDAGLYPEYGRRILYTSDQLAAAQLNNQRLRELLDDISSNINPERSYVDDIENEILEALSTPVDTRALDAYVEQKVKEAMKHVRNIIPNALGADDSKQTIDATIKENEK